MNEKKDSLTASQPANLAKIKSAHPPAYRKSVDATPIASKANVAASKKSSVSSSVNEQKTRPAKSKHADADTNDENMLGMAEYFTKGKRRCVFWIIIFLCGIGGLGFQIYEMIDKYMQFKLITTNEAQPSPVLYPDVYVCVNTLYSTLKTPTYAVKFSSRYQMTHKFWRAVLFDTLNTTGQTNERLLKEATAAHWSFMHYGMHQGFLPQLDDMLYLCYYKGALCKSSEYRYFANSAHGLCLRFQPTDPKVHPEEVDLFVQDVNDKGLSLRPLAPPPIEPEMLWNVIKESPPYRIYFSPRNRYPDLNNPVNAINTVWWSLYQFDYAETLNKATKFQECTPDTLVERCFFSSDPRNRTDIPDKTSCFDVIADHELCLNDHIQQMLTEKCDCIAYDWPLKKSQVSRANCVYWNANIFEKLDLTEAAASAGATVVGGSSRFLVNTTNVTQVSLNSLLAAASPRTSLVSIRQRYTCYLQVQRDAATIKNDPDNTPTYMKLPAGKCRHTCLQPEYTIAKRVLEFRTTVGKEGARRTLVPLVAARLAEINGAARDNTTMAAVAAREQDDVLYALSMKLKFNAKRSTFVRRVQQLKYLISNFFADFGGSLGIWLGLCAFTGFQIIDTFIKLCCRCSRKAASANKIDSIEPPKIEA